MKKTKNNTKLNIEESRFKPLTQKALNSITNTGYLNVWEGAVRSSKTVVSEIAWFKYVYESDEKVFIMSGKTIGTLYKNVIANDFGILNIFGSYVDYKTDKVGNKVLEIKTDKGIKTCYCVGGNDERSYSKIRGLTAGGWYADEVNLQPKSFIEECFRRTIVSKDRKHFWTLNPDNPNHFIYTDFLDKYEKEQLKGFYLWKFYLDDNLAISEERKEELKKQYSGVFYDRYILGKRCLAEGVVYDMFNINIHTYEGELSNTTKRRSDRYIGVDYGTTNPCRFLEIFDDGTDIWVDREYDWSSKETQKQKTDNEYLKDMDEFAKTKSNNAKDCIIVIDPSAESFRVELLNNNYYVKPADNSVIDGIRTVSNLLSQNRIHINKRCKKLIAEFGNYIWDEKLANKGQEKVVKDNDHCIIGDTLIDTIEGQKKIKDLVGKTGKVYCFNEKTKRKAVRKFKDVKMTQKNVDCYKITLSNGKSIIATANHPFLTNKGWKRVDELKKKDKVVKINYVN